MPKYIRPTYDQYKKLRIYKNLSVPELINNLVVLKSCKLDFLVDNAPGLYDKAVKVAGTSLTQFLMLQTYGTKFVAGVNSEQLRNTISKTNAQDMGVVSYYLAELTHDRPFEESDFDYFLSKYIESIQEGRVDKKNGAAVRATALGDSQVLKKMNVVQEKINKLFEDSTNQLESDSNDPERVPAHWASVDKIKENLTKLNIQFEDADLEQIISKVKQSKMDARRNGNEIHLIEWNTNFANWNLVHPELNENPIWLQLSKYSPEELVKVKNYLGRYEAFFDKCLEFGIVGFD